MSSGVAAHHSRTANGSISPQTRTKSFTRKDTARKCLLGSINTRLSVVRHSSPILSGEPMRHDIKFPKVNKSVRTHGLKVTKNEQKSSRSQSSSRALSHSGEISDDTKSQDVFVRNGKIISGSKHSAHGLNLPEIIIEFNIETNMVSNPELARTSPELPEDERAIGAPYEEYLSKHKYSNCNPCRAKYRPVTPELLESLNKLKVPSKARTEQWLKSTQYLQTSHCAHVYKTDRLNNSFPNWIYTDT